MKSIIGDSFQICLFGESHSDAIGVVINGIAPGIELDLEFIAKQLDKRKPKGKISTSRVEADEFKIVSGFFNGQTTGTPLCVIIENNAQNSSDYEATKLLLRPSHADFTANEKYLGSQDYRGGGHFSGRLTAPIVVAGAIATQILLSHNISIGTHIKMLNSIVDGGFSSDPTMLERQVDLLNDSYFPVIDKIAGDNMTLAIENAASEGDSVGGVLETVILNMPAGIGEPFFNSIESRLSQLLFSVPGVKGVEFGLGFDITKLKGSQANDSFYMQNGDIKTKTNNNGGINGGISNAMPIVFKTAIKPTPSIYKEQETVNIESGKNEVLKINGRHDPAIIHRARVVVDSMAAIGLLDLFCERYGYLWM
ncbi:MAG: chorismate synthase [Oscillospiraceae bacterium]